MIKILLIEDDKDYANYFSDYMKNKGIVVYHHEQLDVKHLELILQKNPDLIIMDFFFGDENSLNLFGYLQNKQLPILYLTSNKDERIEEKLLKQGVVDYIDKLKSLAVIETKIKKTVNEHSLEYKFWNNYLTIETKIINDKCKLTNNEYKIMIELIKNLDNYVSTEQIMISLWNDNIFIERNTLVVAIKRLREKLRKYNIQVVIVSQKNKGYKLNEIQ